MAASTDQTMLMGGLDWWKRDGYATEGERSHVGTEVSCGC